MVLNGPNGRSNTCIRGVYAHTPDLANRRADAASSFSGNPIPNGSSVAVP